MKRLKRAISKVWGDTIEEIKPIIKINMED